SVSSGTNMSDWLVSLMRHGRFYGGVSQDFYTEMPNNGVGCRQFAGCMGRPGSVRRRPAASGSS
ncbi:MAG: hypothetical protein WCO82_12730, partial [Sphingomonadales bacterium]